MTERKVLIGMDRKALSLLAWTAIGYNEDETRHMSDDELANFIVSTARSYAP